jgi:hypothetical protein
MTHHGVAHLDGTYDVRHQAPRRWRYTICEQLVPTMELLAPGPVTCIACQTGYHRGLEVLGKIGVTILQERPERRQPCRIPTPSPPGKD